MPVVMYVNETWSVNVIDKKRLGTWDRKISRRVHGQGVQQGIRRIRTNQELRELYKNLGIITYIQNKKLERIGYVEGID
jgi:hypothetical protein